MTRRHHSWVVVSGLLLLSPLLGNRSLWAGPATTSASQPNAASPDINEVKKAYQTLTTALLNDDLVTLRACMYVSNEIDGPLLDAVLVSEVSQHQLAQAALTRFGEESQRLVNYPMAFDENIQRRLAKFNAGTVEFKGDTARLVDNATPGKMTEEVTLRKVNGVWKIDQSRFLSNFAQNREKKRTQLLANARVMDRVATQIKLGMFKDAEDAKAGWALLQDAANPDVLNPQAATQPSAR